MRQILFFSSIEAIQVGLWNEPVLSINVLRSLKTDEEQETSAGMTKQHIVYMAAQSS